MTVESMLCGGGQEYSVMGKGVIHVAGIIDQAEADMLVDCGADVLGFPFRLAKHREDLSEEEAARIVRALGPAAQTLLITYLAKAEEIVALCRRLGVAGVQLHGDIDVAELEQLRALWPGLRVIKSLIVRDANGEALEREVKRLEPHVDAFITDTFDPVTGATGATGKVHDWNVSRRLVEASTRPVILAGGLNPGNVRVAIRAVRPAGVDVHTGIEGPDGRKDRELAARFVAEARAGFAELCQKCR